VSKDSGSRPGSLCQCYLSDAACSHRRTDPYRQALASGLSVQTGFAYLTTPDVCYVWNFTAVST
jgi:hypothetical protein